MNEYLNYKKDFSFAEDEGFSLVELIAVIAILSALGSITIPNVLTSIKLSKIDEAKALMNSYAADCLSKFRFSSSASEFAKETPENYSDERLSAIGYKTTKSKNKCTHLAIEPISKKDDLLFALDFRIDENTGKVLKTAVPADNIRSLNSCKGWAGENCGASEEQKAEWARLAALAKAKSECGKKFLDWKNVPNSGSFNRWDDLANTCSKLTWVFEGRIVGSKEAFDEARKVKYGELCEQWEKKTSLARTTGGPLPKDAEAKKYCAGREYWFFEGTDQGSKLKMEEAITKKQIRVCDQNKEKARKRGHSKIYPGVKGPGTCGTTVWMCGGKILTTEAAWKKTTCGTPPPPPPPPKPPYIPPPPPPPRPPIPPPPPAPPKPSKTCLPRRICTKIPGHSFCWCWR